MKYENQIKKYVCQDFFKAYDYMLHVEPIKARGIVSVAASAAEALSIGETNLDIRYLVSKGIICDDQKLAIPLEDLSKSSARDIAKELGLCVGFYLQDEARDYWMHAIGRKEYLRILAILKKYNGIITNPAGDELDAIDAESLGREYGIIPRQLCPETPNDRTF